jgi:cobalt-zinc-cadmium efflux system outer membrane protein
MNTRAILSLVLVCVFSSRSFAQDISFAAARAAAEARAPEVQLATKRAGISRAEVDVAAALPNPTLSASTATVTARFASSLSVPVPVFGQRSTAVAAARADVGTARLDIAVTRRDGRWGVTLAWIDLWEAQERARLLDLAANDITSISRIATENFAAGIGSRLDVVRAEADRARASAEAESAHHLASAAGARLAPWIGRDGGDDLTAVGSPGYSMELEPLVQLEQRLPEHLELQRDRAAIDAARAHVESEQRQRWPLLTPQVGISAFDPTTPGTDVIMGMSFEVPVLDRRRGAIERARAERALAETAARLDERRLRSDLLDAFLRTQAASSELRALRENVLPAMDQAKDMTHEGYQAGRIDLLHVLDAQRAWLETRIAEVGSLANFVRAVADLERAAGADFARGEPGDR